MACVQYDVAIIGSSFAGSLLAVLARRLGKSVVLLERGRHPRFVIGESSTPLANLLLEELADKYELPWLRPFAKWGSWQSNYSQIPCGLKRGFSFYFHQPNPLWRPTETRDTEMLVAASPHDDIADTHWYRPDFDAHFVAEAQRAGVEYLDQIELDPPQGGPGQWELAGQRPTESVAVRARFLVDASGPRGYLARSWGLPESVPTEAAEPGVGTQALYTHFRHVNRWQTGRSMDDAAPPFPPDDAALHHVFPGGWIWVLRFNNGLVSAGCAVSASLAESLRLSEGAGAWARILERFPSVAAQFAEASPVREFTHLPRLAYRSRPITGPGWCLLPGTAGFIDPLLSTGFVQNLLGLERLAALWARGESPEDGNYGAAVAADLSVTSELIRALYRAMPVPRAFRALSRLYFASVSYAETARRLGRPALAPGFLLRLHPLFSAGFSRCVQWAVPDSVDALEEQVQRAIGDFDVVGLTSAEKRNWHGCDAAELYAAAPKLGASFEEITAMLRRSGFNQ